MDGGGVQAAAADALYELIDNSPQNEAALVAAGAIPAFAQLLVAGSSARVQRVAACVLGKLATNVVFPWGQSSSRAEAAAAIVTAGAIPSLVQLLSTAGASSSASALNSLASHAQNVSVIVAAGAISPLLLLLKSGNSHVKQSAAGLLRTLAADHTAAVVAAADIPSLVLLLRPASSAGMQIGAVCALSNLANHGRKTAQKKAAITAAGAIPALARLLAPDSSTELQCAAAGALRSLAPSDLLSRIFKHFHA
jgi:hypothetical protein